MTEVEGTFGGVVGDKGRKENGGQVEMSLVQLRRVCL